MRYVLLPIYSGILAWVLFRISINVLDPTPQTSSRAKRRRRRDLSRSRSLGTLWSGVYEPSPAATLQAPPSGKTRRAWNESEGSKEDYEPTAPTPHRSAQSPHKTETLSKSVSLGQLAEEASVLLELFSKIVPDHNDSEAEKQKPLVDTALERILTIQRELRKRSARGDQEPTLEEGETKVDAACVVCYSRVANTVVMPCKHLALCTPCCDTMGIKEKNVVGREIVKCPVCRTSVLDRMKVFRG